MSKSFDAVVSPVQTMLSFHAFREEHCKLCYCICGNFRQEKIFDNSVIWQNFISRICPVFVQIIILHIVIVETNGWMVLLATCKCVRCA